MQAHSSAMADTPAAWAAVGSAWPADSLASPRRSAARRKSDPTFKAASSPLQLVGGGWEFPLTRSEKQQRVLILFEREQNLMETEMAEAQTENIEREELIDELEDENEALRRQLVHDDASTHHEAQSTPRGEEEEEVAAASPGDAKQRRPPRLSATRSMSQQEHVEARAPDAPVSEAEVPGCATAGRFQVPGGAPASAGAVLLVGLLAVGLASLLAGGSAPAQAPVANGTNPTTVQQLWVRGREKLAQSSCRDAEALFDIALQAVDREPRLGDPGVRAALACDRGFALVCSHRFQEGAMALQESLPQLGNGTSHSPLPLLNALGYAQFKLQEYKLAGKAFTAARLLDKEHPMIWNNIAAASLAVGDIQEADNALFYAVEYHQKYFDWDPYHLEMYKFNGRLLQEKAFGSVNGAALEPMVELWNPYPDVVGARA